MEKSLQDIVNLLSMEIANMLKISVNDVDINKAFDHYGLDSSDIVSFSGELGEKLNFEIDPVIFYEHNTIAEVSQFIAKEMGGKKNDK
jgi:acyl carrier protein